MRTSEKILIPTPNLLIRRSLLTTNDFSPECCDSLTFNSFPLACMLFSLASNAREFEEQSLGFSVFSGEEKVVVEDFNPANVTYYMRLIT